MNIFFRKGTCFFMDSIIYEYEEILLGQKTGFTTAYFMYSDECNHRTALAVFRHVFETYLKWDPEDIKERISWDILERMKVNSLVRYIMFPPEIDEEKDLFYIASLLYPRTIKNDFKKSCLMAYKKVLNNKNEKLPKGFLSENEGLLRGHICLQYVLNDLMNFESLEELYGHFASSNGVKTLKKYRLSGMCTDFYETPLDFVHNALPEHQKNEFLYKYYKFKMVNTRLDRGRSEKAN